jgi:hypothetical protein
LTLQVHGTQHDGSDLLANWGKIPWIHCLSGLLDAGDLNEPDGPLAQIDEKPERVMAQHDARRDNPVREACLG